MMALHRRQGKASSSTAATPPTTSEDGDHEMAMDHAGINSTGSSGSSHLHYSQSASVTPTKGHDEKLKPSAGFGAVPRRYIWLVIIACQCALAAFMLSRSSRSIRSTNHAAWIVASTLVFSLPIFMLAMVGLGLTTSRNGNTNGSASFSGTPGNQTLLHPHQQYIPLAMLATILSNSLPTLLTTACASVSLLLFGLLSRPNDEPVVGGSNQRRHRHTSAAAASASTDQQQSQSQSQPQGLGHGQPASPFSSRQSAMATMYAILLMIAVLLVENFCVWVVSASYAPSHNRSTLPDPLQDNGQLAMKFFFNSVISISKANVVKIRNIINVQWALVTGLGLSFVTIVVYGPTLHRNILKLGRRTVLALALSRFLRTISFLITVLPSQNKYCYFSRFPDPPPTEWKPWIQQGMVPYSHGGCNDLIISGHATATATLACLIVSTVNKPTFTVALWSLVAMDYMVEVYEGFHYSVDMWLGCVLANFTWNMFAFVEDEYMAHNAAIAAGLSLSSNSSGSSNGKSRASFKPIHQVTTMELIWYAMPAAGCFLQVGKIFPREMGNYTIIAYVIATIGLVARSGFDQYALHTMFCVLYITLGVYL